MRRLVSCLYLLLLSSTSSAVPLWQDIFDTSLVTSAGGKALAIDNGNSIYAVGTASVSGSYRWVIVRYHPNGIRHWAKVITPLAISSDNRVIDVDSDSSGVYVFGRAVLENSGYYAYCLAKFDSLGNQLWQVSYDGAGYAINEPKDLTLAGDKIVLTGYVFAGSTHEDIATVAYSTSGSFLWANLYSRLSNSDDRGFAIDSDSAGNIYVTGTTRDFGPATSTDAIVIKYSPMGEEQWVAQYDAPAHLSDGGTHLTVSDRHILVAGFSVAENQSSDFLIMKYTQEGALSWATIYAPECSCQWTANCKDTIVELLADESGDIFVVGNSRSTDVGSGVGDIAVLKYDNDGNERWIRVYSHSSSSVESAVSAVLDNDRIHLLASVSGQVNSMILVGYTLDGLLERQETWSTPYAKPIGVADLAADKVSNLLLLGSAESPSSYLEYDPVVLKYPGRCCAVTAGDLNATNNIDLSDLSLMIGVLTLQSTPPLPCVVSSDLNRSGLADLTDLSLLIAYLTVTPRPVLSDCP